MEKENVETEKKIKPALYPKRGDRLLETETRGLMRRGLHTANKKNVFANSHI